MSICYHCRFTRLINLMFFFFLPYSSQLDNSSLDSKSCSILFMCWTFLLLSFTVYVSPIPLQLVSIKWFNLFFFFLLRQWIFTATYFVIEFMIRRSEYFIHTRNEFWFFFASTKTLCAHSTFSHNIHSWTCSPIELLWPKNYHKSNRHTCRFTIERNIVTTRTEWDDHEMWSLQVVIQSLHVPDCLSFV